MATFYLVLILVATATSRNIIADNDTKVFRIIVSSHGAEVQIEEEDDTKGLEEGRYQEEKEGASLEFGTVNNGLDDQGEVAEDRFLGNEEEVLQELQLLEAERVVLGGKAFFEAGQEITAEELNKLSTLENNTEELREDELSHGSNYVTVSGEEVNEGDNEEDTEDDIVEVIFFPKRQHTQFYNSRPELLLPKRQHTQFRNSGQDVFLQNRQHTQFRNSVQDISIPKRQHTQFKKRDDVLLAKKQEKSDDDDDIIKVIITPKGRFHSTDNITPERNQHTTFYKVPGKKLMLNVVLMLGESDEVGELKLRDGDFGYTVFKEKDGDE